MSEIGKKKILIWLNNYNNFEDKLLPGEIKEILRNPTEPTDGNGSNIFEKDCTIEGCINIISAGQAVKFCADPSDKYLDIDIIARGKVPSSATNEKSFADLFNEHIDSHPEEYIFAIQLSVGSDAQFSLNTICPAGDIESYYISSIYREVFKKIGKSLTIKKPIYINSCRTKEKIGRQTTTSGLDGLEFIEKCKIPCLMIQMGVGGYSSLIDYYLTEPYGMSLAFGLGTFMASHFYLCPRRKDNCNFDTSKNLGNRPVSDFKKHVNEVHPGLWEKAENIQKYYGKDNPSATKNYYTGNVKNILTTTRDEQVTRNNASACQDELTPIEQEMGEGGDQRTFYLRNYDIVVGTNPPQLPPIIVDDKGSLVKTPKLTTSGVVMAETTAPSYFVNDQSYGPTGHMRLAAMSSLQIDSSQTVITSKGLSKMSGALITFESSSAIDLITSGGNSFTLKSGSAWFTGNIEATLNVNVGGSLTVANNGLFAGKVYSEGGFFSNVYNGVKKNDYTKNTKVYVKPVAGAFIGGKITGKITFNGSGEVQCGTEYQFETSDDTKFEIDGTICGPAGPGGKCFGISEPHNHMFYRLNGELHEDSGQMRNGF